MAKKENAFQASLIQELHSRFPGCIVLKNDPNYIQGIPDLLLLTGEHWAAFECKQAPKSGKQNNQEFYIDKMNKMSKAYFINPTNKEEVLDEVQRSFSSGRRACSSKPK